MDFREQAQHFIENEKQFHLGDLITEKSHPITVNLSQGIQENTANGVIMLFDVDNDIIPVAKRALLSNEFDAIINSIRSCIEAGHTVCFSSCGASGRLAIILESMWREFCRRASENHPEKSGYFLKMEEQVFSIMTGGDRALIRSVENFEDYQVFGRRQFIDSGLGEGDLLIALTEGGEISSVIGTMKEALDRKAGVCMLFNNPREILIDKFDRSREMLTHRDIIKLDLTTGPMALSGSTRMQATTIAMLIMGAAIEECFSLILNNAYKRVPMRSYYADQFGIILNQLCQDKCSVPIAQLIDIESDCYLNHGRVTYVADKFLLDIFSDTTERAPTFMIPPFRQFDDDVSPIPWAFAKDPLRNSKDAWNNLLKRAPRGLNWTSEDYRTMGVSEEMKSRAGSLNNQEILKYYIGKEDDPTRYNCQQTILLRISVNEPQDNGIDEWWRENVSFYQKAICLNIGKIKSSSDNTLEINIPIDFPLSNTMLFEHLALKLIFNVISTGSMAKIGRIKGNWMVQLDATNKKLTDRAIRVIAHFADLPYEQACIELFRTMNNPNTHRLRFENSYIIQTLERLGGNNK